jgi:hypothetical protein
MTQEGGVWFDLLCGKQSWLLWLSAIFAVLPGTGVCPPFLAAGYGSTKTG